MTRLLLPSLLGIFQFFLHVPVDHSFHFYKPCHHFYQVLVSNESEYISIHVLVPLLLYISMPPNYFISYTFLYATCLAYSSDLMMEIVRSYEMSVNVHLATWSHILEDSVFNSII
jgi:hypothetical protein